MSSKKNALPQRKDDLIVQRLGEEAIVYDRSSHRAHSLNRTATLVFEKLDGKTASTSLAKHVEKGLGQPAPKGLVDNAINELADAGLLKSGSPLPRRTVLRIAAALVPVIASIAVPPAAAAASCVDVFGPCSYAFSVGECCYGLTCIQTGTSTFECRAL